VSALNIYRALTLLLVFEAGLSIRRHGWATYDWPAFLCCAIAYLLVEPRRKGESMWARLHRPRQIAITVLALAAAVLFILSMVTGKA
jgi:hypothetical protein